MLSHAIKLPLMYTGLADCFGLSEATIPMLCTALWLDLQALRASDTGTSNVSLTPSAHLETQCFLGACPVLASL